MLEYQLKLAGCDCAVIEWNPSGSILAFVLHGWLDNAASFESLASHMPDVRLIAVDFPGHGHSSHIEPGHSYHFIDGLYLIDDLAHHFELKQFNLIGHSMGAAISSLYAAAQPKKVNRLVMIESLGPLTATPENINELLNKSVRQRRLLVDKRKPIYPEFEQALTARAEASEIDKDLIRPLVERSLTKLAKGYTWRADPRLRVASPVRLSESQLEHTLAQIVAPTLLIEGDRGYLTKDSPFAVRKKWFQHLASECFVGGHHVHLEQPQAIAKSIKQFLTD
jgi:pimeloyl-ACP methyl ester carboxylesterase